MSATIRVIVIDDVVNDEDLKRYFEHNRKMVNFLSFQLALAAASLKAMLRDADRRAGRNRRAKVARPVALAAGLMVLVAKYLALAARRFEAEYQDELHAAGRRKRTNRSIKFGDN